LGLQFPGTYWSAASIILKYIADQERGEVNLRGKKIGLLHLNNPFGREPIPAGIWWASAENDLQLAGSGASGYLGAALHAPGAVSITIS
jgi:hypothetical protein